MVVWMLVVGCGRRADPGFDVVAVPSAAYLPAAPREAGAPVQPREGGTPPPATPAAVRCEPAPTEDFEPSDEIKECPSSNDDGWELDLDRTRRRRDNRSAEDVCCFRRPREEEQER